MYKLKQHRSLIFIISIIASSTIFVGIKRIPTIFHPTTVYITVKLGQGYWWIPTPSFPPSLTQYLQTNVKSHDLDNKTSAQLLKVEQYPFIILNNKAAYNTYLTIKLKAKSDLKGETFYYKSQKLLPGEPFSIKFDTISISGTIINSSLTPPQITTKPYKVTLTKQAVFPWEYEQIRLNSTLLVNNKPVFIIKDKTCTSTHSLKKDFYGQLTTTSNVNFCYVTLTTEMQLQPSQQGFIFGYDNKIYIGSTISINTKENFLENYTISDITPLDSSK